MPSKQRPVSSAASFCSEETPGLTRRGQGRIRQTTTSSLFPYSVVRPPTDHPTQSPFGDPPSLSPQNVHRDYRQSDQSLETPYTSETPLYARSDYDEPEFTQSPSTYSRSSYAGMTTAPVTARAKHTTLGTLGDIREEDERSDRSSELPYTATAADEKGWGGGELVMSPEALTANSIGWTGRPRTDGSWFTTTTAAHQRERNIVEDEQGPFADTDIVLDQAPKDLMQRRSTLPSVLELEDLAKTQTQSPTQSARRLISPASASGLEPMTPAAQQRLGRMSVAPARYAEETRLRDGSISGKRSVQVQETLKKTSGIIRFHQVWRPFIVPGLLLVAALLLTISLLNNPGPVSRYLIAPADAFSNPPRGMANVTLGTNGWCSLDPTMDCQVYRKGDFTAKDSVYNLGEDQLLATLGDLLTALCVMTWLTTLFYLTHAFLHFFLFFSLNLPFTHLLDEAALLAPNGAPGKNAAQAEVDIRVRCEKPPFESMEWVWWAWWAHRRAPVGYIFAVFSGVLAVASFGVVFGLKRSLASEIKTDNVELG